MERDTIENLLRYGERITFECKKAEKGLPKSIWETYSSFANTNGGTIFIGIEEDLNASSFESRYNVIGVHNPKKLIRDLWNTLNSKKVSRNILIDENITVEDYRGCKIIRHRSARSFI